MKPPSVFKPPMSPSQLNDAIGILLETDMAKGVIGDMMKPMTDALEVLHVKPHVTIQEAGKFLSA